MANQPLAQTLIVLAGPRLVGKSTSGAGLCEEITVSTGLSLSGGALTCTVSGGVTDHGALTGLSDDDHTIYVLLAGRSGGQSVIGGTAASNELSLRGTSHATPGPVRVHGVLAVQQIAGVAGTDEVQIYHDGTNANATSVDGHFYVNTPTGGYGLFLQRGRIWSSVNTFEFMNNGGAIIASVSSAGVLTCTHSGDSSYTFSLTPGVGGSAACNKPWKPGVYTFATVPTASSFTGFGITISDRSYKRAYSDGTNWRFFGDDAIIS